jgi:hypothetical protein
MIRLSASKNAWGTSQFEETLAREVEALDPALLPLDQGLSSGSHVLNRPHRARVIKASEAAGGIRARVGLFYVSVIAGCSCADDPTPMDELNEYCEVELEIRRDTAEATIFLCSE